MGKKDKNKKKVSGSVKTAMKTEKKLNAKQKKELAAVGEDDIEKVIAEIEREERRRERVVEAVVEPPSRRVNFSFCPHPFKDELIMFGGEFHDGRKTTVYGDLFFYNTSKNEWTVVKAPGAPPPRCGHQAVVTSTGKGEMWIFGGEFSSPSESQFYHYKDLWLYRIGEKKWEKVTVPGGPSPRSGHRMVHLKKKLFIFGGFHDNLRDYKYFNDLYIFDLSLYQWSNLNITGNIPAPRSGCIVLPTPQNTILVYGGYSKEKIKKDVDKGHVHMDMFILGPQKNDESGTKWKWTLTKQSGAIISPRCSASAVSVQPGLAYIFGGVHDDMEDEEQLDGTFFNELLALDLEKYQWRCVNLSGKKEASSVRRRRRKAKDDMEEATSGSEEENDSDDNEIRKSTSKASTQPAAFVTDDDGIFTMTLGPAPVHSITNTSETSTANIFSPSPRINAGLAVKNGILYLYGGMFEDGDKQFTLNDFYSLDTKKLNEWKTIMRDDFSSQVWLDSESTESEGEGEDSEDETCSDDSDEDMNVE
ncbi:kelch domain-containing protein 4-like [Venturia canescens]|uniref:kelch domain-containing protein 4-like n=1 Tax=Venturia canescens TaxID=32260 RepID=UPI001C9C6405|nr:kelch domain-containing protein 4-like [Venturia canescens]